MGIRSLSTQNAFKDRFTTISAAIGCSLLRQRRRTGLSLRGRQPIHAGVSGNRRGSSPRRRSLFGRIPAAIHHTLHQIAVRSEEFARPRIARDLQRTSLEIRFLQNNRVTVGVRFAGHLAQNPVAAAGASTTAGRSLVCDPLQVGPRCVLLGAIQSAASAGSLRSAVSGAAMG